VINQSKKPTLKQKVEVYEQLLHDLNYHRTVTWNSQAVTVLNEKIRAWSNAHSNAPIPLQEKEKRIVEAFWHLKVR